MSILILLFVFLNQRFTLCYELKTIGSGKTDFSSLNSAFEYLDNINETNKQIWLQIIPSNESFEMTLPIIVHYDCVLRLLFI